MKKSTIKKQVFVNAYKRIRLGKEEYVRQHWRRYPQR